MNARVWIALVVEGLVFAALLFGSAGTTRWPAAWVFLAIFFGAGSLITLSIARHDPALLAERMKPLVQEGQPVWDRILMCAMAVLFPAWLALMGLDAVRFHWSDPPTWVRWLGGVGLVASFWICHRAFRENTFLAPVVKIQSDRGHKVIATGPYAIVRHPLYSGALLLFPSTALLLGSWFGLAAAIVLAGGLVVRTAMEDRTLRRELDGYPEYAVRVPHRLIPWVW